MPIIEVQDEESVKRVKLGKKFEEIRCRLLKKRGYTFKGMYSHCNGVFTHPQHVIRGIYSKKGNILQDCHLFFNQEGEMEFVMDVQNKGELHNARVLSQMLESIVNIRINIQFVEQQLKNG